MSLRTRLFVLFAGLIVVLLGAQWWMWKSLTGKLDRELETVAFEVGRGVVSFFASDNTGAQIEEDIIVQPLPGEQTVWIDHNGVDFRHDKNHDTQIHEYRSSYKIIYRDGKTETIRDVRGPVQELKHHILDIDEDQTETNLDAETRKIIRKRINTKVEIDPAADSDVHVFVINGKEVTDIKATEVEAHASADLEGLMETRNVFLRLQDNALLLGDEADMVKQIPIPKTGISERLEETSRSYLLGSMGIMGLGLLLAAMIAHRITHPLRRLAAAATDLGEGQLGRQVPPGAQSSEVAVAIGAFNTMSLRLKELNEETEAMRRREYLSELGEIANGLAHTIRNPLNTLGLSVEQLAMQCPENGGGPELAQTARGQIRRIDQWIRSFLALASQGVAREEHLNFRGIIEDVVLEALQSAGGAVDLDLDLAQDIPDCPGVAPEMRAVLQALIVNAVEASPDGETVVVRLRHEDQNIFIEVNDRGSGVDPAVREKLFSPHVTTKETGSGMGLFLAGRIISSRYGGRVQLLDREGGGTTARISIPL